MATERQAVEMRRPQGRASRPRRGAALRLTDRDLHWLRFAGRQRLVEAEQLAAIAPAGEFRGQATSGRNGHPSVARVTRRLAELRAAGYMEAVRIFAGPWGWTVTAAGLRVAGLDLEPSRVDYRQYAHDVDCGWLAIDLEAEFGESVWTEREIVAHDFGSIAPAFCPAEIRGGRTRILRIPDLALSGWGPAGEPLAIELERTQKARARVQRIVELYAECPHLAGVRFYCTEEARGGVERAVGGLGYGAESFEIHGWSNRKEIPR